jgi:hypothetical protein
MAAPRSDDAYGIEAVEDVVADLKQALGTSHPSGASVHRVA